MSDFILDAFKSGIHNLSASKEDIPSDSAQSSFNWITQDGKIVLIGGRRPKGAEGLQGKITGLHFGIKKGGVVMYSKTSTAVRYWDGSAWQDTITGMTADEDVVFANYSSLAGDFTFVTGSSDGLYKINNANPDSAINMYDSTINFHIKMLFDRGRGIAWDRNDDGSEDKTGIYGTHIDSQDSNVYTTVSSEAIGSSGSTNYTGTLAFKGSTKRNCFAVVFVATVAAGTETFVDNYDGTLTSNYGGTGTINYATGAYNITFSDTTTGNVTSDYQWEDSNEKGVTDFRKSATRLAGEGFQFPQDIGGDAIKRVLVGQDGAYYSMKERSAYRLSLDSTDLAADNLPYRNNIGISSLRGAFSTKLGIIFMNTANPTKPEMNILKRNVQGASVEPVQLFKHFKFSDYTYDDCAIDAYDRYILVFCQTNDSNVTNNNRILVCDVNTNTVDVVNYDGRMSAQNAGELYIGSSLTQTVDQIFVGFDDDGSSIDNEWVGKNESYKKENLKKFKKLRLKGLIDPDQYYEVYANYDTAGSTLIGTIRGDASYVDFSSAQAIGSNFIGEAQIGGNDIAEAYPYFAELKIKTPKFRVRSISFKAKGIGYVDIQYMMDYDILNFEGRIPKRFRQKQNVSLDGTSTDQ